MQERDSADGEEAGPCPPNYAKGDLRMLLFVSIGIGWLAVLTLLAGICRAAAEGERGPARFEELAAISIGPRLTLSSPSARRTPARRRQPRHSSSAPRPLTRRLRAGHGVR